MHRSLQNGQRPQLFDDSIYRSRDILQLFDHEVVNDTVERLSEPCQVGGFRHFTLYVKLLSESTPTTIHIEVLFLEPSTNCWHTYKQGLFAALFYEDTDCATEICEVFTGDCAGRDVRVRLTGAGTEATKYFDVDISLEFWN